MRGRPGRSFALLVGLGAGLELGGAGVAFFGLDTMARCYWAWFPGAAQSRFPLACNRPIAGTGFHLFVPVAILLGVLCATVILAGLRAVVSIPTQSGHLFRSNPDSVPTESGQRSEPIRTRG
jgi:hypothetical protein